MSALSFVDLRGQLRPPVEPAAVGCFISLLRGLYRVRADAPFWPLARAVTRDLRQAARRGDPATGLLLVERLVRLYGLRWARQVATVGVSNIGPVALPAAYGPFVLQDLFAASSLNGLGVGCLALATTWQACLRATFVYPDPGLPGPAAAALADRAMATLRAAGGEA
ncbi:MAG: hypothetical protein JOY51_09055 [Nevskia sp.]|nr:hypothetical protein [Nevskia sp.]